jgi:hypothetical protein
MITSLLSTASNGRRPPSSGFHNCPNVSLPHSQQLSTGSPTNSQQPLSQVKVKLYKDRWSVGQSVLVSGAHLRPVTNLLTIFRQLSVCWCKAPSLKRGRVCSLQLLLDLASAVFHGSESSETHDHIILSKRWDSQNLEGQVPVFIFHSYIPEYWVVSTLASQSYNVSW